MPMTEDSIFSAVARLEKKAKKAAAAVEDEYVPWPLVRNDQNRAREAHARARRFIARSKKDRPPSRYRADDPPSLPGKGDIRSIPRAARCSHSSVFTRKTIRRFPIPAFGGGSGLRKGPSNSPPSPA